MDLSEIQAAPLFARGQEVVRNQAIEKGAAGQHRRPAISRRFWRPLPVLARRGRCRRSRGRGGLFRNPGHRVAIILESLGALERVLRGIHDQIPFVVVLGGGPDRIEGNGDVLLAHAEETSDADDEAVILPSRSTSTSMISPILLSEGS